MSSIRSSANASPRKLPSLLKKGVKFKSPPQNLGVGPHKGGQCIYFNTPDGVIIEFLDSPLIKKHFS